MTSQKRENGCVFPLRRLFCRLTAPLFRRLFLGPDGRPPFLLARAPVNLSHGHAWRVPVDERGQLIENPHMSVHDKAFWQQTENRNMAFVVAMFMMFALSIPAYIVIISKVGFRTQGPHDFKSFSGIYMVFVSLVSAIVLQGVSRLFRKNRWDNWPRLGISRFRYFALHTVFLMAERSTMQRLMLLGGSLFLGFAFTWSRQVIATYPPTPFVLAHLWGAIIVEALWWTLAALSLLLNALFWPCLECHGLQAETFLYRAGQRE